MCMKTDDIYNIGTRLKDLRKQKTMTLNEMSEYTGLSIGYLSNIERNVASPTLRNIQLICEALGITLASVLLEDTIETILIRHDETKVYEYPKLNQTINLYDFGIHKETYVIVTIKPGSGDKPAGFRHHYDEVGIVIQGQLSVIIDGTKYVLGLNDSIYVNAQSKHSLLNETDEDCISYWVRKYPD